MKSDRSVDACAITVFALLAATCDGNVGATTAAAAGTDAAAAAPAAAAASASDAMDRHEPAADALFRRAPGSPIAVFGRPGGADLGDVDGDGKLDLVIACESAPGVMLLRGDGKGGFAAEFEHALSLREGLGDVVLGDLDGDGHLDLASATHDSYSVSILKGDGKGGLTVAPKLAMKQGEHPHTHGIALGDFDGDGHPDLATVNNADDDVSVALNDGKGGFEPSPGSPFRVGPSPYPMALGDLDGDGHLDIVATASATGPKRAEQLPKSRALTILFGDGKGGFSAVEAPLRTTEPWYAAVGDVNGDGKMDVVASHHERKELSILLGDGKRAFKEAEGSPFIMPHDAWEIALVDLDRDGKRDVLACAGDKVQLLRGDGTGKFGPAPNSPFATGDGTWHVGLGDVNGDGKLDMVTCEPEKNAVTVWLGQ